MFTPPRRTSALTRLGAAANRVFTHPARHRPFLLAYLARALVWLLRLAALFAARRRREVNLAIPGGCRRIEVQCDRIARRESHFERLVEERIGAGIPGRFCHRSSRLSLFLRGHCRSRSFPAECKKSPPHVCVAVCARRPPRDRAGHSLPELAAHDGPCAGVFAALRPAFTGTVCPHA